MKEQMTLPELQGMVETVQKNGDGLVLYNDFVRLYKIHLRKQG